MRSGRRSHIVSFISRVSFVGIALGVAALLTVSSVMNGFEHELRSRILSSLSHITLQPLDGGLLHWEQDAETIKSAFPDVQAVAPYIESEVMLMAKGRSAGLMLRGVDPLLENQVSDLGKGVVSGSLDQLQFDRSGILLGKVLADQLGIQIGESVLVMTPDFRVTAAGLIPRLKRYEVVGVFDFGMYSYDSRLAFVHIEQAARLLRMKGAVTGLRLRVSDEERAPFLVGDMVSTLGNHYWGLDWTRRHQNLFSAIKLQKKVMFIILALIVAVAVFNLIATMVMTVREKRGDIAILRTLGMTSSAIVRIFMLHGTLIGLSGIVIGVCVGCGLSLSMEYLVAGLEQCLGMDLLAKDVYLISRLPGKIQLYDVILIVVMTFMLSVLTTLYPAWKASTIPPAEALNHE
jgi:lipoprotein-releasing system permease protein